MLRATQTLLRRDVMRNRERSRHYTDRFKPRSKMYLATVPVRLANKRGQQLADFEEMVGDGVAFQPEERLPPWKRQATHKHATEVKELPAVNYAGMKLRVAAPGSGEHPGFPTHFQ